MTTVAAKTAGLKADVRGHSCNATHTNWREFHVQMSDNYGRFLFKADPGLFLNLTLFSLLKIRCSIRVWEKCAIYLNKLAWAVVGFGFQRWQTGQYRVGLVGKWPLEWPRGTGSVTFRWHIIVESKIGAKVFFRRGITLAESRAKVVIFGTNVPQLSVFYVAEADCRAISRNVQILAKLATSRGDRREELPALLNYYVSEQTAANETSRNGQERLQKRPNR